MIGIILIINALLGILCVEYLFNQCQSFINVDEHRDSKHPAFRRLDLPYWTRSRLYPGAMTLLVPRIIIGFLLFWTMFTGC